MSRRVWWLVMLINIAAVALQVHGLRLQCELWRGIVAGVNVAAAIGSALRALTTPAGRPLEGTGY